MQALIGYLVAIAVFLGGGYAGLEWLTSHEDVPSAVALKRSTDPIKSTRARLLARKKHEAAAEREANARPGDTVIASEQSAALGASDVRTDENAAPQREAVSVKEVLPAAAPLSKEVASAVANPAVEETNAAPASSASEVSANGDSLAPTAALEADSGASSEVPAGAVTTSPAIKPPARQLALRSLNPAEKQVIRSAVAKDAAGAAGRKQSAAKERRHTARLASASRKPVLMILRTIEYSDGRREQRLLPMPRSRQAYAYAN